MLFWRGVHLNRDCRGNTYLGAQFGNSNRSTWNALPAYPSPHAVNTAECFLVYSLMANGQGSRRKRRRAHED